MADKKLKFASSSGNQQNLEVRDETSIEEITEGVARLQEVDASEIELSTNGRPLKEGTVGSNDLRDGQTVDVSISEAQEVGVSVNLPNGSCEEVKLKPNEKIDDLKRHFQQRYGEDGFKFTREGMEIDGGRLPHHQIGDGSKIDLELINNPTQFTITDIGGRSFDVKAGSQSTIDSLKQQICEETGTLEAQQTLIHAGRQLNSGTLLSNGITSGSAVRMVGRLRGG